MQTEPDVKHSRPARSGPRLRAILLVLLLAAAFWLWRYSPLAEFATLERFQGWVEQAGLWAPGVFILGYTAGVCLMLPGSLLAVAGAAVFGPVWGFAYVWAGSMLAALLSFLIARHLGRDFARGLIGNRLAPYDAAIARHGFRTTLYMRLLFFPTVPMNYGMGLTAVRLGDYAAGTGLGILAETFIVTFAAGTLGEVWTSGDWRLLLQWPVLASLALFVLCFFIPSIVRRLQKRRR